MKNQRTIERRQGGFTFIEVMVAFMIGAVSVAAAMALLGGVLRANSQSARTTLAASLGQAMVDDLLDRRFEDVVSGQDQVSGYTRTWTVQEPESDLKLVTMQVDWDSAYGTSHSVVLRTILSSSGTGGF